MIALPETPTVERALVVVRDSEHPAIANHSIRAAHLALLIAELELSGQITTEKRETIAVAGILHDVGTAPQFNGNLRFEVGGADAAAGFVTNEGWATSRVDQVWESIALHTSPQIAESRGGVTRYVRLAVVTDFGRQGVVPPGALEVLELELPRLDVERELADAVVRQAGSNPHKAPPTSWPGALLASHLANPTRPGLNPSF